MERVFYEDGSVKVTSARFVAGGQTRALDGVLSAAAIVALPSRIGWIAGLMLGMAVLLLGGWGGKLLGLIAVCACGLVLVRQKPVHSVTLRSASGEAPALSGTDGIRIAGVVAALNDAIAARAVSTQAGSPVQLEIAASRGNAPLAPLQPPPERGHGRSALPARRKSKIVPSRVASQQSQC